MISESEFTLWCAFEPRSPTPIKLINYGWCAWINGKSFTRDSIKLQKYLKIVQLLILFGDAKSFSKHFTRKYYWRFVEGIRLKVSISLPLANVTFIDAICGRKELLSDAFVFMPRFRGAHICVNVKYNFRFHHIESHHASNVSSKYIFAPLLHKHKCWYVAVERKQPTNEMAFMVHVFFFSFPTFHRWSMEIPRSIFHLIMN